MHTTQINLTTFHHNGDFSGDVIVTVHDYQIESIGTFEGVHLNHVRIPFDDIKGLVAQYVAGERIAALENVVSYDAILGVPPRDYT